MEISRAAHLKAILENDIEGLIYTYEEQTGLIVSAVHIKPTMDVDVTLDGEKDPDQTYRQKGSIKLTASL